MPTPGPERRGDPWRTPLLPEGVEETARDGTQFTLSYLYFYKSCDIRGENNKQLWKGVSQHSQGIRYPKRRCYSLSAGKEDPHPAAWGPCALNPATPHMVPVPSPWWWGIVSAATKLPASRFSGNLGWKSTSVPPNSAQHLHGQKSAEYPSTQGETDGNRVLREADSSVAGVEREHGCP